jgi:hypothetical protein
MRLFETITIDIRRQREIVQQAKVKLAILEQEAKDYLIAKRKF